ncbi:MULTISPECIES: hypothetical protein [Weeksella]|uniref:Uncharacterized protein n=1 Tax=Weeksella virosa (strain ATCC 43766 / DSM 16922 / JCM 21250 / CCUG 30538 / CDC 9751 / IAM 14551 / NBRC 16016 / NCTC 11634 / CL345/78) TaxID=865938 RepID=F0NXN1_WEEVC|nr:MULTISPECIES: hypothetical protein [Weeksella]ADX66938.1 hypothetical protein Weevi_0216 [Weeksella virosa DSM 16922]MDK7375714.1 hypothetical protein [Weeksella virosa]MDK7674925.1 hypothetical protein [Weeksella virosa]SUP53253.1 Uncharacterised protein [Weeksella virosa]VEH63333.1 Uncharacterised protein [Weeksella virosa]
MTFLFGVFLVLLMPCSTKFSITQILHISTGELVSSNPAKTQSQTSTNQCPTSIIEIENKQRNQTKKQLDDGLFLAANKQFFSLTKNKFPAQYKGPLTEKHPLYILYNQLKISTEFLS